MPEEAHQKAMTELNRLKMMGNMSAEATVSRNYLDTLLSVPWHHKTKSSYDLKQAVKALNKAHYGLDKVKERIIEFLAVQKRVRKLKGPILCLVGPPGVGKTSLGQSIATAMGREFVRMSLGGVRDEAEIRGHRRTYIGSMPGQIMQKMTKVKVKNPLFMLDEIDKMAMDFRGDPASALLEVLDPEQNQAFNDHYLEVDYDLSDVLFIATANTLNIPDALLDRMEVIHIAGYTENEKLHIAQQYLIPKQKKQNGLKASELQLEEQAILDIIRYYTLEAGVRNLEREIAKLCRRVVMALSEKSAPDKIVVSEKDLEKYLGIRRFRYGLADKEDTIGQVTGLAWTSVGGELLTIESTLLPGTGKINYTGQLGDVMQESIQTAFTLVRSRSKQFSIEPGFYEKVDVHIHVPEGATPKDGPSAGIGMCTALFSSLMQQPVRADVAMTGEITLLGKVLPIGGLKEKLLAAHRGGIRLVIIPEENKRDLKEIPKNVLEDLEIHSVRWIDEVLDLAFRTPLSSQKNLDDMVSPILTHHTYSSSDEDHATD
jgi:ATP-dependent Lon protease